MRRLKPLSCVDEDGNGCGLCCRVMRIQELDKPADVWCEHFKKGKGCGIYASRPGSCASFKCLWLVSQDRSNKWPSWPIAMRPDKLGVIFDMQEIEGVLSLVLQVDAKRHFRINDPHVIEAARNIHNKGEIPVYVRYTDKMARIL